MSNTGKVIQITARPAEAADLAVEVDGTVEARSAQLGDAVTAFDFAGFYAILGSPVAGADARLRFTSQNIRSSGPVAASTLLTLRAESLKAALDKAILARENAFYNKYGSAGAIAAKAMSSYSHLSAGSKPQLLASLSEMATQRDDLLQTAYIRDDRTGIVKSSTSQMTGHTESVGKYTAANTFSEDSLSTGSSNGTDETTSVTAAGELVDVQPSGEILRDTIAGPGENPLRGEDVQGLPFADGEVEALTGTRSETEMTLSSASTASTSLAGSGEVITDATGCADEAQTVVNTGYDYHVPSIEAKAQYVRAQISLIDEQYDQFLDEQKLANLPQIFANELEMMDLDVKQLQVAYLNTILLSPISGVVTAIFANPGDSVRAGQALVRVENNLKVLLEATLVYRNRISIGDPVTVRSHLFSKPNAGLASNVVSVSGTVVAARGGLGDDRWNIVVRCDNRDSGGQEILPMHYSFDYDDTAITIS